MHIQNVLLIGGSGFVGTHFANLLSARGINTTVPTRRRERAKHLVPLPFVDVVEADVNDAATLARLAAGKDLVVNLVGVLHGGYGDPYGSAFARAHVDLPKAVVAACKAAGVPRLIHMSALNADPKGSSMYLRSKADGEAAVWAARDELAITVFRPSVIFGANDRFLNLFANLLTASPVFPLAGSWGRVQPVHIGDVGKVFERCLSDRATIGQTYELCGAEECTIGEVVHLLDNLLGTRRKIIELGEGFSRIQAGIMELLPVKLLSVDNLNSLDTPSVCHGEAPLPFGLRPLSVKGYCQSHFGAGIGRPRYYGYRLHSHR